MNEASSQNKDVKKKQKYGFISFVFILSIFTFVLNITFLFNWVDTYWSITGMYDGRGYTLTYYFMHISYISLIFILIWSSIEITVPFEYRESEWLFIIRYFTALWSMIVWFIFIWIYPQFIWEDLVTLWTGDIHIAHWDPEIMPISAYMYSLINILQITLIHTILPILCFVYFIKNGLLKKEISKRGLSAFLIISNIFMFIYYLYTAWATTQGYKAPYIFIDFGPVHIHENHLKYWFQICIAILFLTTYNIFNIFLFIFNNKYFEFKRTSKFKPSI